jgi:DNA-binding transcriptional LysR family regulator
MELRHLRYFVAVAEHLHFGRAAEELATAQPSLSRQIQQLEDELGVKLFERTNKRVNLTDAGRAFLLDAKLTLRSAEAGVRHARESAEGTRGELLLGFIGGAMMVELPVLLRAYRQRYPNVEVIPKSMYYPEHAAALIDGRIDVAWTIPQPNPEIDGRVVSSNALLAVVHSDHPLAAGECIDLTDFGDEPLVTLTSAVAAVLHDTVLELCLKRGFRPSRIYAVGDELTTLGFVAAGYGVSIVPESWSVIHIPGVAYRPLTFDYRVNQTLSWHRERFTPLVRSFVDTASDVLSVSEAPLRYRTALGR